MLYRSEKEWGREYAKRGTQKKGFVFFVFRRRSAAKKEENIFLI
jgi:hypothetical protein